MTIYLSRDLRLSGKLCKVIVFNAFKNIWFRYLLDRLSEAILKNIQNMFSEEIRTKLDLSYISIWSLSVPYNSKFILKATSLGTNVVVVTRVHCILQ